MGKKKSKLKKGGVRVASKGFNDVSEEQREELIDYFDKFFSGNLDEPDTTTEENNDQYGDSFDKELAFIIGNSTNSNRSETIDQNPDPDYSESMPDKKEPEIQKEDLIDSDLTDIPDDKSDESDEENEGGSNYGFILQIPFSYDEDYQQVNLVSNMRNAASYNLFRTLSDPDVTRDNLDDDQVGLLATLFKNLVILSTHPTCILDLASFDRLFIKELNCLPENAFIQKLEYNGETYIGMLLVDQERFKDSMNKFFLKLSENKVITNVLYDMLYIIAEWGFVEDDIAIYLSKDAFQLNQACIDTVYEYCDIYGTTIVNTKDNRPSIDEYFNTLAKMGKIVGLKNGVIKEYRHRLVTELESILFPENEKDDTETDEVTSISEPTPEPKKEEYHEEVEMHDIQKDTHVKYADYIPNMIKRESESKTVEESESVYVDRDDDLTNTAMMTALAGLSFDEPDDSDSAEDMSESGSLNEEDAEVEDVTEMPDIQVTDTKESASSDDAGWVFIPNQGVRNT